MSVLTLGINERRIAQVKQHFGIVVSESTWKQVGVLTHSSARLSDFYRELGDIFGVPLSAHNRWHSFKNLRERWLHYVESTLLRPVLFIDEAQEMPVCVLNELRLLTSAQFDSHLLLSVILAGGQRLNEKLRRDELVPLGSRIRVRFNTEYASTEQLMQSLQHLLACAGNSRLMTQELMQILCDHAMGNYRALCTMANELLTTAALQEKTQLDKKLYLECFVVEMPELNDEAVAALHNSLQELMKAFESHYFCQLQRHYYKTSFDINIDVDGFQNPRINGEYLN